MGKRVIKTLLFHSLPSFSSSLSLNSNPKSSSIISRQNLLSVISRFVSTYSPDNLDGLIDPDDPFSLDNSRVKPVSAEDFAFLQDSSMDSSAVSGSSGGKLDSGKVVKAFELYTDMVRMGGVAELSTFVHLIKGLININKWEEALQLSDSICQMQDIHWLQQEDTSSRN